MIPPPPRSTLFPYTTLFRSQPHLEIQVRAGAHDHLDGVLLPGLHGREELATVEAPNLGPLGGVVHPVLLDRKSTRLDSSHSSISYAVFCLKKKKKKKTKSKN